MLDLIKPDTGHAELFSKQIAAVLENDVLFANRTDTENMNSFRHYFKYNKKDLDYYVKVLGLVKHLNKKVQYYSKGMKRKLSILATLLRDTDFIIADEPTSDIDPKSRLQIRNLLLELRNKYDKSIFSSTHDLAETEKICDTFII